MTSPVEPPFLVALNLTRRCNLRCAHCYLDAGTRKDGGPRELDTGEVVGLLDQIAALSDETMVVLTGGEPLLRPDILPLARHATDLGLIGAGAGGRGRSDWYLRDDVSVSPPSSASICFVLVVCPQGDPIAFQRLLVFPDPVGDDPRCDFGLVATLDPEGAHPL